MSDQTLKFYFIYRGNVGTDLCIQEDPYTTVIAECKISLPVIKTSGGDAYSFNKPGDGGDVRIETGSDDYPPESFPPASSSLYILLGEKRNLSGVHSFHSVDIYGRLKVDGDLTIYSHGDINISGGEIIATGEDVNSNNGYNINIYANGYLNIGGYIDVSGKNGDSSSPIGGNGGNVKIISNSSSSALSNNLVIGSIITRGGDADEIDVRDQNKIFDGGTGGNITIIARTGDLIFFGEIASALFKLQPDTLPPPPPFSIGACRCSSLDNCTYVRPSITGERPELLRTDDPLEFKEDY